MSSYYRRYDGEGESWWTIIICFLLVLAITFGTNSCSAETWNDGICPNCEVRYELRGVSKGFKYYACPECGQEVSRY